MANDKKALAERIPVCPHGTREKINRELILKLEQIEARQNCALIYTSGFRCPECNKKEGGAKNSSHMRGFAADIRCRTSGERFTLINSALACGFKRIGIGKTIIHLDVDSSLPQKVAWLY